MKKTMLVNLLIACLLLLAGVVISKNDTKNYQNQMDRGNIQDGALILPTKSTKSIPQVLRSLEAKKITNYQIYFIQKNNPNLSYVYMSKEAPKLPMNSGRSFTQNDFKSEIPFVILGQDVAKDVYKPQTQAYYKVKHNYYSVIGTTGLSSTHKLNKHIFVSASPSQNNKTQLKHYQIVVDGNILKHSQKLKTMQHIMKAKHSYRSANHINNIHQSWWTRWGVTAAILLVIAFIVIYLSGIIQVPTIKLLQTISLTGDSLLNFQFGSWLKFVFVEVVTFGIAALIIYTKIQIISWKYLNIYLLLLFVLVNFNAIVRMLLVSNKE